MTEAIIAIISVVVGALLTHFLEGRQTKHHQRKDRLQKILDTFCHSYAIWHSTNSRLKSYGDDIPNEVKQVFLEQTAYLTLLLIINNDQIPITYRKYMKFIAEARNTDVKIPEELRERYDKVFIDAITELNLNLKTS